MGHERVGYLPKSKKWRSLVEELATYAEEPTQVARLAANTITAIGSRFSDLAHDPAVVAAFTRLVTLAQTASTQTEWSPIAFAQELERDLPRTGSLESRALAQQSVVEALLKWQQANEIRSGTLFPEAPRFPFQGLSSGAGFSEAARLFFASLTLRYLNYFLEREASSAISSFASREKFGAELKQHVDDISRHAFETARITQSLAAGWFNKNLKLRRSASSQEIKRLMRHAFAKLREDLRRGDEE